MLTLRRKKDQDIFIVIPGRKNAIRLTVTRFVENPQYGMEVELGFECDNDIDILRHEIYKGKQ